MTARKIPDIIKQAARDLRKNMTDAEALLWWELRDRKLGNTKFLRQYPVYLYTENSGLDRYVIPDFISKENKLIIEVDGSIHNLKEIYLLDREKEKLLQKNKYTIMRFANNKIINNLDICIQKIASSLS